jgi:hypothetical protein
MLLTGSGDELCGPRPALFQAVPYHLPTIGLSAFPFFVYYKFTWRSVSCSSPLLQCTYSTPPPLLCCVFLFSFLFIIQLIFFEGQGYVSLSRVLCWFIPGVAVGILCATYLLTCWSAGCLPSRFGASVWSRHLAAQELLFSQCNVSAEVLYVLGGGPGYGSPDSSWCFFLSNVVPVFYQNF